MNGYCTGAGGDFQNQCGGAMSITSKKAGPKPRASAEEVEVLRARVTNLESALSKIAVLAGHGNNLAEFGLKRWEPSAKDMGRKYT